LACFGAAALLLMTIPTSTVHAERAWIDPATLPWVPAPKIWSDLVPRIEGVSCTGTTGMSVSTGPRVESVAVTVESRACRIAAASVTWTTTAGTTYAGDVDAATGEVSHIVEVARQGAPTFGGSEALTCVNGGAGADGVPSTNYLSAVSGSACANDGDSTLWTERAGHTWLHFWSRDGYGNENVVSNLHWGYSNDREKIFEWKGSCNADGRWSVTDCFRMAIWSDTDVQSHTKGSFRADDWPHDEHGWTATTYPNPDQTVGGQCTSSGDLPWFYGSTCKPEPGYE